MYGNEINLADALFISAFSISVVFIILFLISTITDIVAFFINGKKSKKPVSSLTPVLNKNSIDTRGVDDATVAVIAAAISCMTNVSSDKLIIKSIKRIPKWK